jgi:hypothetical protein
MAQIPLQHLSLTAAQRDSITAIYASHEETRLAFDPDSKEQQEHAADVLRQNGLD